MAAQRRLIDRFLSATMPEGDPQAYVDWLVVQHTCEWCGGTIDCHDGNGRRVKPVAVWCCWEVKHKGWVSQHWKHWRICTSCHTKDSGSFGKWIFPIISNVMAEHASLDALLSVQPMSEPNAQVFYADYARDMCEHLDVDVLDSIPVWEADSDSTHPLPMTIATYNLSADGVTRSVVKP